MIPLGLLESKGMLGIYLNVNISRSLEGLFIFRLPTYSPFTRLH